MLVPENVSRAIEAARVWADGTDFHFKFHPLAGTAVNIRASCSVGSRSICARVDRVVMRAPSDVIDAAEDLIDRLRVVADGIHRAVPSLFFTQRQGEQLGAIGLVDLALDQFRGTGLHALALAPDLFAEFLLGELDDGPSELANEGLRRRGVPIVLGGGGVNYVFAT